MHPPSKKEGLRGIGYSMNMVIDKKKSNFGSQDWLWFQIWFIMTFNYKMRHILLQNASVFLL